MMTITKAPSPAQRSAKPTQDEEIQSREDVSIM
jgi:hypothetical protein